MKRIKGPPHNLWNENQRPGNALFLMRKLHDESDTGTSTTANRNGKSNNRLDVKNGNEVKRIL